MDTCPDCRSTQPYFAVLRACLLRRRVELSCCSCGHDLTSRTPLVGMQILWIAAGLLVVFRGVSGAGWNAALPTAVGLALWIATFWLTTPWLCRLEIQRGTPSSNPARTSGG